MRQISQPEPSYLFTLRVWRERLGNGQTEWRGQIRHVLTGQVHYFSGWSALAEHLQTLSETIEVGGELAPPTGESTDDRAAKPNGET